MSTITTIAAWDAISASRSVINTNFSNLNTDKAELSGATFTGDIIVPAEVYGVGWNGSNEAPTKNDLYDKIQTLSWTGDVAWPASSTDNAIARYDSTTGKLLKNSWVTIWDTNIISWVTTINTWSVISTWQNTFSNTTSAALIISGWITFDWATNRRFDDGSSNELLKFPTSDVASAVNEFTISNAATWNWPTLSATGWDTNIDLLLVSKWSWTVKINWSTQSWSNTGDQTITLTGAVTGSGTGSFATTIATPWTVTVSSTNSTATAHTHAVTSSSAPWASASLLATDASGHIGSTWTRIVKLWATDITATNAISGSITGNSATVTTNANLTGAVTSTGNATLLWSFTTSQLNTALSDNDIATWGGTATGTNTWDNATNTSYTTLATTLWTANSWSAVQTFLSGMMGLRNVANTFTSFFTNTNTASRTYTLQDSSDTLVGRATTDTLTNKRVTKRVVVTTQSATPSINTDNGDIFQITGLAQAITSMTTNLTWTPVAWDMMMIQITDSGVARAITWWASFASTTVTLPTTTVISTMLRVWFQRNNANTVWDCIAVA